MNTEAQVRCQSNTEEKIRQQAEKKGCRNERGSLSEKDSAMQILNDNMFLMLKIATYTASIVAPLKGIILVENKYIT